MKIATLLPGQPMADVAAAHLRKTYGARLAETMLLLPTRRAAHLIRHALTQASDGTVLLARMLALGDLEAELPGLLPPAQWPHLHALPPAMPEWRRLALLMQQVHSFGRSRGEALDAVQTLRLAQELAQLQDRCVRHGVALTMEGLNQLPMHDTAGTHWELSRRFLSIVAETWPAIEAEEGMITVAARQVALLTFLAEQWAQTPPVMPVIAIGSTASQPATAQLLRVIAGMEQGKVLLPGLDPAISPQRWQCVSAGDPLFYLKQFLDSLSLTPADIPALGHHESPARASLWLAALTCSEQVPEWREQAPPTPESYRGITLLPCAHAEEEARVLTLLIREAVAEGKRTALITPDEGLMARVAAHLARYRIQPDRLKRGTLATTESGSLLLLMLDYAANATRSLPLLSLLRHPLWPAEWQAWLAEAEPYFRGLVRHTPGQLPALPAPLRESPFYGQVQQLARQLAEWPRQRQPISSWVKALMDHLPVEGEGRDHAADALEGLSHADMLGDLTLDDAQALIGEALQADWRGGIHQAHPGIVMLTPVEARLQQFDRVLLANMQDQLWPGLTRPNAWLNLAAQQTLGLPSPETEMSLMAHDTLLLGSQPEVFLSWPARDSGNPTTRSRYIERLVTYLAVHGIPEAQLEAPHYRHWAKSLDAAEHYRPAPPASPMPPASRRPKAMAASRLDKLTTDPYYLYACYTLGLRERDMVDKEADASELGMLVHGALAELTGHWNATDRAADAQEIAAMAEQALMPFAANPHAALFWKQRLGRALHFVNTHEAARRAIRSQVRAEVSLEQPIAFAELPGTALTLRARLDRVEEGPEGMAISDYKTGAIPSNAEVADGRAPQLLAYALMLEAAGKRVDQLDYWEMPAGRRTGDIKPIDVDADMLAQLHQLLETFMNPASPLLARPLANTKAERYTNPYDGISRYDEWAG